MDMERAKTQAFRKHAEETLDELATVCHLLRASASNNNAEITVDIILAVLKDGFLAGWSAAIDYCMQPLEKEVPAGTTKPDEHTSNTTEPVISETEERVK